MGRRGLGVLGILGAGALLLALGACSSSDSSDTSGAEATTTEATGDDATATSAPGPPACAPGRPATPGVQERTVDVDGVARTYLLFVPPSYTGEDAVPVVWTFHGLAATSGRQLVYSGWAEVAEAEGFLVVSPQALGRPAAWSIAPDGPDAALIDAVSASLRDELCTDPARWYANGISNGSATTTALACASDRRFAAFGLVAASFYTPLCDASPPAPIVAFHGTADTYVPYDGGLALGRLRVDGIESILSKWAAHNRCDDGPRGDVVSPSVTRMTWSSCNGGADVVLYTIDGGGHTWPGGGVEPSSVEETFGTMTTEIVASEIMWEYFAPYHL